MMLDRSIGSSVRAQSFHGYLFRFFGAQRHPVYIALHGRRNRRFTVYRDRAVRASFSLSRTSSFFLFPHPEEKRARDRFHTWLPKASSSCAKTPSVRSRAHAKTSISCRFLANEMELDVAEIFLEGSAPRSPGQRPLRPDDRSPPPRFSAAANTDTGRRFRRERRREPRGGDVSSGIHGTGRPRFARRRCARDLEYGPF